jgi:hypothetical protein
MTQDVTAQLFHTNFDHASSAVTSTLLDDWEGGKNMLGSSRGIRPTARPPQDAMIRLAVLNALRPVTYYARI